MQIIVNFGVTNIYCSAPCASCSAAQPVVSPTPPSGDLVKLTENLLSNYKDALQNGNQKTILDGFNSILSVLFSGEDEQTDEKTESTFGPLRCPCASA